MLALGSESSRTEDGDIDVRGHPPLVIVQINQGHHLAPLRDDAGGLLRFLFSPLTTRQKTEYPRLSLVSVLRKNAPLHCLQSSLARLSDFNALWKTARQDP